jgi:hypothetical protein
MAIYNAYNIYKVESIKLKKNDFAKTKSSNKSDNLKKFNIFAKKRKVEPIPEQIQPKRAWNRNSVFQLNRGGGQDTLLHPFRITNRKKFKIFAFRLALGFGTLSLPIAFFFFFKMVPIRTVKFNTNRKKVCETKGSYLYVSNVYLRTFIRVSKKSFSERFV